VLRSVSSAPAAARINGGALPGTPGFSIAARVYVPNPTTVTQLLFGVNQGGVTVGGNIQYAASRQFSRLQYGPTTPADLLDGNDFLDTGPSWVSVIVSVSTAGRYIGWAVNGGEMRNVQVLSAVTVPTLPALYLFARSNTGDFIGDVRHFGIFGDGGLHSSADKLKIAEGWLRG